MPFLEHSRKAQPEGGSTPQGLPGDGVWGGLIPSEGLKKAGGGRNSPV